jgi:SWI/SNF-related matrix-associated actin-dependent regulator of chromatin subfamily A3
MRKLSASYLWCLTGTTVQKHLDDFGALLIFIGGPPFLFQVGIERYMKKTIAEKKQEGLQVLKNVVAVTCLRRTRADPVLGLNLSKKEERTELIEIPREDKGMYEFFKQFCYLTAGSKKGGTSNLGLLSI